MAFLLSLPLLLLILMGLVVFVLHFLPSIVAWRRQSPSFLWIFLINLFFGWTLIGWVVALVWAMQDRPRRVVR